MAALTIEQQRAVAIARARQRAATPVSATAPPVGVLEDVGKAIPSGLAQGAIAIPGLPGDFAQGVGGFIGDKLRQLAGKPPVGSDYEAGGPLPTSRDIQNAIGFTPYEPQTMPGKFAGTIASFAPGAAVGGAVTGGIRAALPAAVKYSVVPGIGSEAAGELAKGTPAEPYARIAGALAGGGLQAGIGRVGAPIVAPVVSRLNPTPYARAALAKGIQRSGRSVDEIANALTDAQHAGQPVFTVADAMGNSGQRLLSTVARNPHDARQGVVESLQARQAGQGRRVANALAEGFDAPDTAVQRTARLTAERDAAANSNYAAARQNANPVDVSEPLARINEVLRPGATGVMNPGSALANDTVEAALTRARALLGNGREQLTDFNAALRAKQDISDMIGRAVRSGANNQARLLTGVERALDDALAAASEPYANARNAYRQGSQTIEAVDAGRNAARRGRPEDTTRAFAALSPEEQAAFRAGYADPLIEQAQTAATGVNKARPLINDATAAEFPAFAAPGRADQLAARLGREQTMFETNGAALGGSKTADNLADAADMAQFDPSVMRNLFRGKPIQAAIDAATKVVSNAKGMTPPVLDQLAAALMETNPVAARRVMSEAMQGRTSSVTSRLAQALIRNVAATHGGIAGRPLDITVYGGNRGRAAE